MRRASWLVLVVPVLLAARCGGGAPEIVRVEVGDIPVGETVTVTLRAVVAPGASGEIATQGTVTAGNLPALATDDPDPPGAADPTVVELVCDPDAPGDCDDDGAENEDDNCRKVANGPTAPDAGGNSQLDADGDGFGNACDCDFDQSLTCNIDDFNLFLPDFAATLDSGIGTDMDGNGSVGISDFNLFLPGFVAGEPGPSGLVP